MTSVGPGPDIHVHVDNPKKSGWAPYGALVATIIAGVLTYFATTGAANRKSADDLQARQQVAYANLLIDAQLSDRMSYDWLSSPNVGDFTQAKYDTASKDYDTRRVQSNSKVEQDQSIVEVLGSDEAIAAAKKLVQDLEEKATKADTVIAGSYLEANPDAQVSVISHGVQYDLDDFNNSAQAVKDDFDKFKSVARDDVRD